MPLQTINKEQLFGMQFTGCPDTDMILFSILGKQEHVAIRRVNQLMDHVMKPVCDSWESADEYNSYFYIYDWRLDEYAKKCDTFAILCGTNKIGWIKWMLYQWDVDVHIYCEKAFRMACKNGYLEIAKCLINHGITTHTPINIHNPYLAKNNWCLRYGPFQLACINNHPKVAQWLVSYTNTNQIPMKINPWNEFENACVNGYLELAQWLHTLVDYADSERTSKNSDNLDYIDNIVVDYNNIKHLDNIFQKTCENGHLEVAQWLAMIPLDQIDIDGVDEWEDNCLCAYNINNALKTACTIGRLDMAKWLVEYGEQLHEPIHVNIEKLFIAACSDNRLNLAKWLFEYAKKKQRPIDVYEERFISCRIAPFCIYGNMFMFACLHGNLKIARWLWVYGKKLQRPFDIHAQNELAFRNACCGGYLDVAQWLVALGKKIKSRINIHASPPDKEYAFGDDGKLVNKGRNYNCAFNLACAHRQMAVVQWLCSINSRYSYTQDRDGIIPHIAKP